MTAGGGGGGDDDCAATIEGGGSGAEAGGGAGPTTSLDAAARVSGLGAGGAVVATGGATVAVVDAGTTSDPPDGNILNPKGTAAPAGGGVSRLGAELLTLLAPALNLVASAAETTSESWLSPCLGWSVRSPIPSTACPSPVASIRRLPMFTARKMR